MKYVIPSAEPTLFERNNLRLYVEGYDLPFEISANNRQELREALVDQLCMIAVTCVKKFVYSDRKAVIHPVKAKEQVWKKLDEADEILFGDGTPEDRHPEEQMKAIFGRLANRMATILPHEDSRRYNSQRLKMVILRDLSEFDIDKAVSLVFPAVSAA